MKKYQKMLIHGLMISMIYPSHPVLEHALPKLSDYGFFKNPISNQIPIDRVYPYNIASPLFSDYAEKLRYIMIPDNKKISYDDELILDFPIGTVLIKTFYYLEDVRNKNSKRRLLETRLLKKISSEWIAIPYAWNDEQTDAELALAGERVDVSWIHGDGRPINITYGIPNINQCKSCHVYNNTIQPIGPKIRNLNIYTSFDTMVDENQLLKWVSLGILEPIDNLSKFPVTASYENAKDWSIEERARAWLDINCAHCHRSGGPAETSGLHLNLEELNPTKLGVFKPPVAAGRGSGGRLYNIVPGHPEKSIMEFRINSTDPGIMMPELNRKLVHEEGLNLIRAWIRGIPD